MALLAGNLLFYVAVWTGAIHLVVAIADFAFQRWQFEKRNMMSLEEVKREYKENEGDPLIKRRRKQLRSQLMAKNPVALARSATALISNPTHIAVALYYDGQQTPLPVIDAIGADLVAQQMIAAATAAGLQHVGAHTADQDDVEKRHCHALYLTGVRSEELQRDNDKVLIIQMRDG
ncbi:flagellar biosynthesis protein FlhB [Bradyrhizobium ottawaense]